MKHCKQTSCGIPLMHRKLAEGTKDSALILLSTGKSLQVISVDTCLEEYLRHTTQIFSRYVYKVLFRPNSTT